MTITHYLGCALLLAFTATDAAGSAATPQARSAEEMDFPRLDRSVRMSETFASGSAYTIDAPLERAACADSDKRRQLRGRLPATVIRAASEQLMLPMGSGRFLSVQGERYLFCLEPHYREPGTGRGPTGWHKGVTVYAADATEQPS